MNEIESEVEDSLTKELLLNRQALSTYLESFVNENINRLRPDAELILAAQLTRVKKFCSGVDLKFQQGVPVLIGPRDSDDLLLALERGTLWLRGDFDIRNKIAALLLS